MYAYVWAVICHTIKVRTKNVYTINLCTYILLAVFTGIFIYMDTFLLHEIRHKLIQFDNIFVQFSHDTLRLFHVKSNK